VSTPTGTLLMSDPASTADHGSWTRPDTRTDVVRSLFESSGICMACLDPGLRVLEANPDFFRQFGHSAAEASRDSFCDLLHPGAREQVRRQFAKLTDGHRTRVVESIVGLGPRATVFSGELTGIAIRSDNGQLSAIVVLVRPDKPHVAGVAGPKNLLNHLDARILEGVAAGASTVQLASKLYLSRQGIEYRVGAMLRRLNAPNRAALVSRAYSMGFLSIGCWPPKVLQDFVR
jgi:PAS domain S-box-containing protein